MRSEVPSFAGPVWPGGVRCFVLMSWTHRSVRHGVPPGRGDIALVTEHAEPWACCGPGLGAPTGIVLHAVLLLAGEGASHEGVKPFPAREALDTAVTSPQDVTIRCEMMQAPGKCAACRLS